LKESFYAQFDEARGMADDDIIRKALSENRTKTDVGGDEPPTLI
jgi:hypothetical protein